MRSRRSTRGACARIASGTAAAAVAAAAVHQLREVLRAARPGVPGAVQLVEPDLGAVPPARPLLRDHGAAIARVAVREPARDGRGGRAGGRPPPPPPPPPPRAAGPAP